MKKLIAMMLMLFPILVGCADKEQRYISDLHNFCYSVDSLTIAHRLVIIDSRSIKDEPSFFNDTYQKRCDMLNSRVDSIYLLLLDCPKDFKSSMGVIKNIYQNLKKSEDLVRATFANDYRWRTDMWSRNNDSISAYGDKISNSLYKLKADIPQAFTNGKAE